MVQPQKPLDLSKMPSMGTSLSTPMAMGALNEPLQNKGYAKTHVRAALDFMKKKSEAGGKNTAQEMQAVKLLKRRLTTPSGTPTVSHAVERTLFAGELAAESALKQAGQTHLLKSAFRTPGVSATQAERRALKMFVARQKPPRNTEEIRIKTARAYIAQRAEESGEVPPLGGSGGTDRDRLKHIAAEHERREYAGKVLESAEKGKDVQNDSSAQRAASSAKPAIPFAPRENI